MSKVLQWGAEDIEFMRQGFLKGEKIKVMARHLNRTPTALNKALTRFGIRERRPNICRGDLSGNQEKSSRAKKPANQNKSPDEYKDIELKTATQLQNLLRERQMLIQRTQLRWTPMETVIGYLKKIGHNVELKGMEVKNGPQDQPSQDAGFCNTEKVKINRQTQFLLNGKTIDSMQLLMLANKYRLAEEKNVFLVPDVTW